MSAPLSSYLQVFNSRRIAVMVLMGLSSGLPLALTGGTLQAWMAVDGVDLRTIGIFSLVGLPYTLKFLWSPFMDRFAPPRFRTRLGRRRGWILLTQALLLAGIFSMGMAPPKEAPGIMAVLALCVAFFSASQDIVADAYRTDTLREKERGLGSAVFVTGYRIGMILSGAVAMILSDRIGWQNTYFTMAGLMTIGMVTTLISPEPDTAPVHPRSLQEAVTGPLTDFFSRRSAGLILLLIILYKLGDAYAGTMTTAFLLRGLGFSATDVGTVNKGLGLISVILGATIGGTLMVRFGLFLSLLIFGILQAVSTLSFVVLVWAGKSYAVMVGAVAFENLTGGMGTAAFVALLMTLCNQRYSATQFALLSSLAALGRVFITPTSGYVVEAAGWGWFFVIATLTAVPGLLLLLFLKNSIEGLKQGEA
ncbi:MAG: muropeptide transporter AmpG [Thermodesulfovibrio sp.]|nr:muropeptide transporter AmpG [Thermodesulfovibrio sp.]